jgi:hypothetical protein
VIPHFSSNRTFDDRSPRDSVSGSSETTLGQFIGSPASGKRTFRFVDGSLIEGVREQPVFWLNNAISSFHPKDNVDPFFDPSQKRRVKREDMEGGYGLRRNVDPRCTEFSTSLTARTLQSLIESRTISRNQMFCERCCISRQLPVVSLPLGCDTKTV